MHINAGHYRPTIQMAFRWFANSSLRLYADWAIGSSITFTSYKQRRIATFLLAYCQHLHDISPVTQLLIYLDPNILKYFANASPRLNSLLFKHYE